jgi:photosystem II stability/assembly factor-like uncharacterized protein
MKFERFLILSTAILILSSSGSVYSQWTADTLGMGKTHVVSICHSGNYLIAGALDSGIYYKKISDNTWKKSQSIKQVTTTLAVSGNIVVAGTGKDGIYYSKDNGKTWLRSGLNKKRILTIVVNGNYLLAGTSEGIYKSTDNGVTWPEKIFNLGTYSIAIKDDTIYAGTGTDVYKIINNGAKWYKTNLNKLAFSIIIIGNIVLAGVDRYEGVYQLNLNETVWKQTLFDSLVIYSLVNVSNIVFAATSLKGVRLSVNSGESWIDGCFQDSPFMKTAQVRKLYVLNSKLYAATGAGIYTTNLELCIEPGK